MWKGLSNTRDLVYSQSREAEKEWQEKDSPAIMGMEEEGNEEPELSLTRVFHNRKTAEFAEAFKYDPPGEDAIGNEN